MTLLTRLKNILFALTLVLGLAALTPRAQATGEDAHIFLCFRATAGDGGSTDYLVDLGLAGQFTGAAGDIVNVPLGGDILTDLQNIYGSDWNTRGDVLWSVSGVAKAVDTGFAANTMFATREESSPGAQSPPWQRLGSFSAGAPAGAMQAMSSRYARGTTTDSGIQQVSQNNPSALIEASNVPSSYTAFQPNGVSAGGAVAFGYFDAPHGIESTFANGTDLSVLDFYQLVPGSGDSTLLGYFRMNSDGTLTFRKSLAGFNIPPVVGFSVANYSVPENAGVAHLTLQRAGDLTTAFSVTLNTADGTGASGTDYTGITNQVIDFAANETSKSVDVTILNRPGFQGDRSFTADIAISAGTASTVVPSTATITISEVDPPTPIFSFANATYSVTEGTPTLTVTVNRAVGITGTASVNISTVDGTNSVAGTDFTGLTNQAVNFANGQTSQTVDITILDPSGFQGDRTFQVSLSGPSNNGSIGTQGTATITVHDNDQNPAGTVAFSDANFNTTAPNSAVVTLNRTNGTTGTGSVLVSLAAGGTLDASDITFASPVTVNFADGATSASLTIPINASASPLPGTFNLHLSSPVNVSLGTTLLTATVNVAAPMTPDKIKPKIKLTSPKPGKANATFDIVGQVAEADPVALIQYQLNGSGPISITPGAAAGGVTPFSVSGLTAQNGANTLLVQAFDNKGTASLVTKVVFTFTNSALGLEGIYTGLIQPTGATGPGGDLNNAAGLLTATVGKTGTFTGKVVLGGSTFVISGVLENNGAARFKPLLGNTLTLATKGKAPIAFGDLAFSVAADATTDHKLTGTIGAIATVSAPKAFYDGKINLVDQVFLNNKGKFTGVFPAETQTPVVSTELYPQGDGIANVTILKTGKLSLIGKLADGTAVSMSCPLSKDYKVSLHQQLYTKKGSIGGTVALDTAHTSLTADMEGSNFLWLRPAQPKAKQYLAGWPTGITVDFMGAAYVLPPKGTVQSVFPFNPAGSGNVELTFADGLLTNSVTHEASISTTNKIVHLPATDKDFTLVLVSSTGAFKGVFKHTDGTKPAFSAVIYQKGATAGAYGYFLSNPTKNGPAGQGGGVTILQHP